jgi:hypothetical protein
MHPEFPLERTCSDRNRVFQLRFAREALLLLPDREDGGAEATHEGLVLRGETESALEKSVALLQDHYGDRMRVSAPTVRFHRAIELEEPHMGVRILCAPRYFHALEADLAARGAKILDAEVTPQFGALRATAPLTRLLGYPGVVAELSSGSAREVMWLSHYAPVERISGEHSQPPPQLQGA